MKPVRPGTRGAKARLLKLYRGLDEQLSAQCRAWFTENNALRALVEGQRREIALLRSVQTEDDWSEPDNLRIRLEIIRPGKRSVVDRVWSRLSLEDTAQHQGVSAVSDVLSRETRNMTTEILSAPEGALGLRSLRRT